jgi:hypothetical protein
MLFPDVGSVESFLLINSKLRLFSFLFVIYYFIISPVFFYFFFQTDWKNLYICIIKFYHILAKEKKKTKNNITSSLT